jgi:polyisoprenoid-binding protein YceI
VTATPTWSARIFIAATTILLAHSALLAADGSRWILDPARSRLNFAGTQTGVKFEGDFKRYDAEIEFDPDHLDASHIKVAIELASAATGDTQRDAALPSKDWLDIAEFPQATFETTSIRKQGVNTYEAIGNLKLRGVTKSAILPFTLQIDGALAHVVGHVDILRSDFGVGQGPWATDQWVALNVAVDFDIVASRGN